MPPFRIVYLIDDDRLVNMISERIIKLAEFASEVVVYSGAGKALEGMSEIAAGSPGNFPEIIFLDTNMPEIDGWGFLEAYGKFDESLREKCKVFILSSSIDTRDINKAKTYNTVSDFISKPLSFAHLEKIKGMNAK